MTRVRQCNFTHPQQASQLVTLLNKSPPPAVRNQISRTRVLADRAPGTRSQGKKSPGPLVMARQRPRTREASDSGFGWIVDTCTHTKCIHTMGYD